MLEMALPTLMVFLVAACAPKDEARRHQISVALALGFFTILARYLAWRLIHTVLPADELSIYSIVVWAVFLVELMAWIEMAILICVILRKTNHSPQADIYEARFQSLHQADFPMVDVFIATYNEPLEVLEKTIAGTLALSWPKDRLNIHVLDDGRRDWLRNYCAARGVIHMTRDDNRNAKAGNINAALDRTSGEFILILDADFVPNSRMLHRAVGFFDDPKIGIVQMPHYFFNGDPIQTSLNVQGDLPDEQRFFFDVIQPGRDGWGCAFCCGSNGIIRRDALQQIGGAMPTDSITEDMLLTMALLRKGYITRYLNERLAIGLAPENLQAYFVQRARWAQGAIQIMFLKLGPFGPGLRPIERLLFVPSHWISQSICQPFAVLVPGFFLVTGIPPILNATVTEIFLFQVPAVAGGLCLMQYLAPAKLSVLSATAQAVLQAFRIMPTVLSTLVNPGGHVFKVTPKGADARNGSVDHFTVLIAAAVIAVTALGLILNANFNTRIVSDDDLLPVVAFWAIANMVILLIVITMAVPRPIKRLEERFIFKNPCALHTETGSIPAETLDLAVGGVRIQPGPGANTRFQISDVIGVELPNLGVVPGVIKRILPEVPNRPMQIGVSFALPSGPARDALIQQVFAYGATPLAQVSNSRIPVTLRMLSQIFKHVPQVKSSEAAPQNVPDTICLPSWLAQKISASRSDWQVDAPDPMTKPGPKKSA